MHKDVLGLGIYGRGNKIKKKTINFYRKRKFEFTNFLHFYFFLKQAVTDSGTKSDQCVVFVIFTSVSCLTYYPDCRQHATNRNFCFRSDGRLLGS